MHGKSGWFLAGAIGLIATSMAWAQCEIQKVSPAGGEAKDQFGQAVAMTEEYAVVGANKDNETGFDAGAAYVFRNTGGGWVMQTKLTGSAQESRFGTSVTIDGDTLAVGAPENPNDGPSYGAVLVYERDGENWVESAALIVHENDDDSDDQFGISVDLDGDWLIVGASRADVMGGNAGAAYVFHRDDGQWTMEARLTADDASGGDYFGESVAISSEVAVVGAKFKDVDDQIKAGAAYVFRRANDGSWGQEARLTASDAQASDWFGHSVDVLGDTVLVGAPREDSVDVDAGATYRFANAKGWQEVAKVTAMDGKRKDTFGWAVGLMEDSMIIGADGSGKRRGGAYVSMGGMMRKLVPSDPEPGDRFGRSVCMAGGMALVGGPQPSDRRPGPGFASFFTLDCQSCTGDEKLVKLLCVGGANKIKAKIKKAQPGALVSFTLDGDASNVNWVIVPDNGEIKTAFKAVSDGDHTFQMGECDLGGFTTCGD